MELIERKLHWQQPVDGYEYRILVPGRDEEGDVEVHYRLIRELSDEVRALLQGLGLSDDDMIIHLNKFYPNGRGLDEDTGERMREGVGTEVLRRLTEMAVAHGAKAMYAFTNKRKKSMSSFLRKHDFHEFDGMNFHAKIL